MRPIAVNLTALLCLVTVMKVTRSDFVINLRYYNSKNNLRHRTIFFNETNLSSLRDCICKETSKECSIQLFTSGNKMSNVSSVRVNKTTNSPEQNLFIGMYNCQLFAKDDVITCQRILESSNTDENNFMYISDVNTCDWQCIGIIWYTRQTATVSTNTTTSFKKGRIPDRCWSTPTLVTETSTPTTTPTKIMRSATTPKTNAATKTIATSSKTPAFNDLANDTILPAYTVTTHNNGSLNGSSDDPDSNTSIIVGVTVSFAILIALVLFVFFLIRWRQRQFKETGSCMKPNVTGSLVETCHGTCDSSYSEMENDTKGQYNVSKYQYSQTNSALISENSTNEYSNVKVDAKEKKSSDSNPLPTPIDKSVAEIVQSNGGYSLASVSNKQASVNSPYSIPDNDTDKFKPQKAKKNVNSLIPTDDTYSNVERPRQEHNTFAVFQDSTALNYQLAMNINDAESQNKQEAASLDTTANTQMKDYAVLGDHKREFTNPYNCSFDPTSSSIQTVPTNSEPSQYNEKCENPSPDYCLASALINNDKMSQFNSNSNTKGDGVQIVTSEYDLAKE